VSPLEYSQARIRSVLEEIDRLKDAEFPHIHSRNALDTLEKLFLSRLAVLETLSSQNDVTVVQNACAESLTQILKHLPLLGFILRSTNVRNSFEVHRPLLQLARRILGQQTKLILSSEWEFSPFVYNQITELPEFVLIGLPASESGNPLLIPLAGHELGHTIWSQQKLKAKFVSEIDKVILQEINKRGQEYTALFFQGDPSDPTNLFVLENVAYVSGWASRQAEEAFCDFVGTRVFGSAYLHAFAYLLSPGPHGLRPFVYPNNKSRARNILLAAAKFGVSVPVYYPDWFIDLIEPQIGSKDAFLLSLADSSMQSVVPKLMDEANSTINAASLPDASEERVKEAVEAFRLLVPATNSRSLATILNAAWESYHDASLWQDLPHVAERRSATLNDLVLKTIEVLDIEEILGGSV